MEANSRITPLSFDDRPAVDSDAMHAAERTISVEWLAYVGLALLAIVLRVAALGSAPISDIEARGALHAWHTVEDDAPGFFQSSSSPLTYTSQILAFTSLGASEFTARIGVALAGVALSLLPLLFRNSLGVTRTFVWAALLSLLTVPVAAARAADGTTFMILFTVLAIWMIRRYWYSQRLSDALWAIAFVTFMLLLSSPAGIPLLVILLLSGWLAVWRTALSAPQRLELPGDDILQLALKRLQAFPFARTVFVPVLVVGLTATSLMLNPAGLRTVSELVNTAISGITLSQSAEGVRLGFAALLAYEPLLIVFALGGAWLLWKKGDVTYIDRFAAAWAAVGTIGLFLYPGARAADAMWVVLPLTLLASYGITQLMVNRRVVAIWENSDSEDTDEERDGDELYTTRYAWAKWAISAGVLVFLFVLSVQFMQVSRLLLDLPSGAGFFEIFSLLTEPAHFVIAQGIGLLALTAIIAIVVFLLVANFWGYGTCLQGIGIGFMWLLLFSGVGGAWQSSVVNANHPDGLWRESAVSDDAYLLRETFFELADRDSAGFPLLDISIVADQDGIIEDDGLIAWLARDFPKANFVNSASAASGEQIVLMVDTVDAPITLGGDYVGQRFVLRRRQSIAQLGVWDLPAWWSQGRLRGEDLAEDAVMLWLRQDVYDGIPIDQRPD